MNTRNVDIAIIGGGCAGMSAALAARKNGANDIVIFERSPYMGGVLRQCIHNGFGIHLYGEDLTGTQYAKRLTDAIEKTNIRVETDTIVLDVSNDRTLTVVNRCNGLIKYQAKALIFATGCRERSRGALLIPGSRPAGVYCAGTAQRYMNIEGYLVGQKIVILGSGDIGLIMARQFVLEGADVIAVAEIMPYSSGLMRNIVQCIEDFDIPIYYQTTVTRIVGEKRVEGIYLAEVDQERKPIPSTERFVDCDTLVLSVGLIPENELGCNLGLRLSPSTGGFIVDDSFQTEVDGVFACGNALHVHDLVDFVSIESEITGKNAAQYVNGNLVSSNDAVTVKEGYGVRGIVPQKIRIGIGDKTVKLQFRPTDRFYDKYIHASSGGNLINQKKFRVMTPGEMCEINVKRMDIRDTITVQVVE